MSQQRRFQEQNLVDFDALLLLAWRILNENPAIANLYRRLYKFILIDEAQDLNYAQYHLVKTLCGEAHSNIFMVGDPRQSIHGYAGADKKFMLEEFVKDFGAEKLEIQQNYRSSQAVIDFATRLTLNGVNKDAYYQGIAKVHSFPDEHAEAEWIISKIKELVDLEEHEEIEGEITLEKMAILARNRDVFLPLLQKMEQDEFFNHQYFVKKSTDALEMETRLMKLFDLGSRILCNPSNQVHFHQMLLLLKIENYESKAAKSGLERLSNLIDALPQDLTLKTEFTTTLASWNKIDPQHPKMNDALDILREYLNVQALPDEEKTLLHHDLEDYQDTWKKFLQASSGNNSLTAFRQFAAMGLNIQRPNQKGLTLATVHMMKGLEFDIVFVMGMNEGTFPDYRAKDDKGMEEEKNNAYVAFTRARRWLYVTYPLQKNTLNGYVRKQIKSRFL
ncbi:MAG: ATP-dependent helicase [Bacteroidota bacterium]